MIIIELKSICIVMSLFIVFPHTALILNISTLGGVQFQKARMIPFLLLVIMQRKKATCKVENVTEKPTRYWRIEPEVKFYPGNEEFLF